MKIRTLLGSERKAVGQEIRVELHGGGGELVAGLAGNELERVKKAKV